MASEGPRSFDGAAGGSIGDGFLGWTNPLNVSASDNSYATVNPFSVPLEFDIRISKNAPAGTIAGDNKSTGAGFPGTDAYTSYGGASDLWGQTWSVDDINASTFGPLFRITGDFSTSRYLYTANYGFSIPSGATIDGILLEVEKGITGTTARVDHIRITVYYTEGGGGGAASTMKKRTAQRNRMGTLLRM